MAVLNLRPATLLHTDERGWAIDPMPGVERDGFRPQNVHLVSVAPGCVRGNHYHRQMRERICLFGSRARIAVVDRHTGAREERDVADDKAWLLDIAPNVSHAIKNVGTGTLYLLCYADRPYDRERPDVTREVLMEGDARPASAPR